MMKKNALKSVKNDEQKILGNVEEEREGREDKKWGRGSRRRKERRKGREKEKRER